MLDLFVRDFYLKNGMIPVDGFSEKDIKSFHQRLESLSSVEKRQAKRKFRKFVRKINTDNFKPALDFSGKPLEDMPTKKDKRRRRRKVHAKICHVVNAMLKEQNK